MTKAAVALAEPKPYHPKPYHHGDLRRALLDAAGVILERDGPSALTLRAVAREAGVSPAAPYYHFKDKSELIYAIAQEGFDRQRRAMAAAMRAPAGCHTMGVAYVEFAQAHPALYRVMYDCARSMESLPGGGDHANGYALLKQALAEASGGTLNDTELELSVIAAWCMAHGMAEICAFPQFKPLKDALGGERAFLKGVLDHMGTVDRSVHA